MSPNTALSWVDPADIAAATPWQLDHDLLPLLRAVVRDAATAGIGARLVMDAPDGEPYVLISIHGNHRSWRAVAAAAIQSGETCYGTGTVAAPVHGGNGLRGALVIHYHPVATPDSAEYTARTHAARIETLLASAAIRLATTQGAVDALLQVLAAHDPDTARHAAIVRRLARAIGDATELTGQALLELEWGALLHDIGKTAVSQETLRKSGPLSAAEWALMRQHPAAGERIVRAVPTLHGVAMTIRHHHERWDGTGYPDRLSGDTIPLTASIVALVDAYEVMRTGRPYRAALDAEEAIGELRRGAGTQFDPTLVSLLPVLARYDLAL